MEYKIQESELHQALVAAINRMLHQKEYLLQPFEAADIAARYQNLVEQQKQIDNTIIDLITQHADRQDWDGEIEPFRMLINKRRKFPPIPFRNIFNCLTTWKFIMIVFPAAS